MHFRKHATIFSLVVLTCAGLFANDAELKQDLTRRRQAVTEKMSHRGMLVLFSAELRPYSRDVEYEFRQESNLYYLTGIAQPGITLVLMPQNASFKEILFLPDRDATRELWDGKMLSHEEAGQISGIDTIWSASEFESFVDSILSGRAYRTRRYFPSPEYKGFFADLKQGEARLFLHLEDRPGLSGRLSKEFQFADRIRRRFVGLRLEDASPFFAALRVVKSDYEIGRLRRAIDITTDAHREVMKHFKPGMREYEAEALIEYIFRKNGSLEWGFPSIVASGPNALILHYDAGDRQTRDGELILIDIGADYNYYTADVTRTIPVSGKFTKEQAEIYQIVLDAQKAAMSLVKPGTPVEAVHRKSVEVVAEGLLRLGLIRDKSGDEYRRFFPHGTSHWLGIDVHDPGLTDELRPGMVLTVEPGIYLRGDDVPEKYRNIGIRIEDDILVTADGYELLSKGAPREIGEIEALMRK